VELATSELKCAARLQWPIKTYMLCPVFFISQFGDNRSPLIAPGLQALGGSQRTEHYRIVEMAPNDL
jgi:hypothetical protein